jgi:hypothetical protein
MFYCCFRGEVPMIFGCPIVGSRLLRDRFGDPWSLARPFGMPSIAVRPSFVTPSKLAPSRAVFKFIARGDFLSNNSGPEFSGDGGTVDGKETFKRSSC